ncbi:hypothetical protein [Moritella marina]|uniref:hypothetical protein n=1 Tax=Moritella marina TaxID=90736 RepID=UPI003704C68C
MYYYRFLRAKKKELHPSELTGDIEFYTSRDCGTNRDFTWNEPVKNKMASGQDVQLLFGMENLPDAVKVLKCFGCYDRVLARFKYESIETDSEFTIHSDEQVNVSVCSKYIMSDFNGKKITIPTNLVEVLSIEGWIPKKQVAEALNSVSRLNETDYESLIANA